MPDVLLVEDRPNERQSARKLLERAGLDVHETGSHANGIRLFKRHASTLAAVVTDLWLDESREDDRGGERLAREIREFAPTLPIYCISAYRKSFRVEETGLFDGYFDKGSADPDYAFDQNIERIKASAVNYERESYRDIPSRLLRLKRQYRISDTDFKLLFSLMPIPRAAEVALLTYHNSLETDVEAWEEEPASDQTPPPAQRVRVVEPGSPLGERHKVRLPITLVIAGYEGYVLVEMCCCPMIYTYGDTEEEGVEAMVELLHGYHGELSADTPAAGSVPDLVRFRAYLKSVFDTEAGQ